MTFRRLFEPMVNLAVRALLIFGLVFGAGAPLGASLQTGKDKKNREQTKATPAKAAASKPAGGMGEGIQVHGHWTIEVRNPDGKLVTHREFENALVGGQVLTTFLGRTATVGIWRIVVNGAPAPCLTYKPDGSLAGPAPCIIAEVGSGSGNFFLPLSVSTAVPPNNQALLLTGTFTAGQASLLDSFGTEQQPCPPTISPAISLIACLTSSPQTITSASVSPVQVVAGQIVTVTAKLSFS